MKLVEPLKVDVDIRAGSWAKFLPKADDICCKATTAAIEAAGVCETNLEVSIVLADDIFIQSLNKLWRQQDIPTNVLAFPCEHPDGVDGKIRLLGDIIVADGVVKKEAFEERKSVVDHLSHMVVHGALHLLGYNHVRQNDYKQMLKKEQDILKQVN